MPADAMRLNGRDPPAEESRVFYKARCILAQSNSGWCIFDKNYSPPEWQSYGRFLRYFFVILFFLSEIQNLKCHLILRDLRIENSGKKGIPKGFLFNYVSCANYFWEFISWLCFSIFVGTLTCYIFTFLGLLIMANWALKKHREYHKHFGDKYPKNRKAIIPFII